MQSAHIGKNSKKTRNLLSTAAAMAVAGCFAAHASAGAIVIKDADGSLRTWTTDDNTTPLPGEGGQYNPPQSNSYSASVDQTSGTMTGRFGIDSAMVTAITLSPGSMVSYDYKLTNEQRNFRGTGASNWVGDSYGDFRGADLGDFIGYLISGRAGYQFDFHSDRLYWFQDAGFGGPFGGTGGGTEDTAGVHVRWNFFADSGVGQDNYYVTVTNVGEATPFAFFRGSTGGNAVTDTTFFRQGLDDSEQDVTLSNFYQYATSSAPNNTTFTWTAASGNYSTSGNWSAAGTPALGDDAVIGNGGTSTVNTSGPNAAKAFNLHVGGGSTLEVLTGGELFVGNTLGVGNSTGTGTLNQSGGLVRLMDHTQDDLRIALGSGSSGTYNLSGGELAVGDSFTVGRDGNGTFNMTGGLISQSGFITVGGNPGSTGTFIMSGGVVNQTFGDFEVGNRGTGTANLSGGTFNVAPGPPGRAFTVGNRAGGVGTATISGTALVKTPDLFIAGSDNALDLPGGSGTLNINGGELQIDDDFIVGNYGNGTLSMTGGLVSKSGYIVVGNYPGSSGTFNLSGGTILQTFGDFEVGDEASGVANLSGGSFTVADWIAISNRPGGNGQLNVSGAALVTADTLSVGDEDAGTLNVTGGDINLNDDLLIGRASTGTATISAGTVNVTGWIVLADEVGSSGTLNMSGGTINQAGTFADLEIGDAGTGTLNLSGGTINVADTVVIANQAGSSGDANISGGTLNSVAIVNNSTSSLDVSGTGVVNTGPISGPGAMTVSGSGVVNAVHVRQSSLTITGNGSVTTAANGQQAGVSVVDNLSIDATGTLDLKDNDFVVNNGSFSDIYGKVLAGAFSPTPVPGAISSTSSTGVEILAMFDNALIGATDWNGLPIGASAIVGKYTYMGDVNIDGQVTGDDYAVVDSNLDTDPALGLEWLSGDANLDGIVTGDDYATIDSNLGLGVGNPLSPSSLTAVPEPASVGLLAATAVMFCSRRRRRAQL